MHWSRFPVRPAAHPRRTRVLAVFLVTALAVSTQVLRSETVAVRYSEGLVHGFLALRTLEGETIADGDLVQSARGDRVTSRLTFRFKDGSVHDETAVFTQRERFRLVSDHLVQKGPTFPMPVDLSIDAAGGTVVVKFSDDGKPKTESERMDLPPDLANGLVLTLLKNVTPDAHPESFSFIAATPKPQLVKLQIGVAGRERFSTGRTGRTATRYVLKVDIGGLKGVLADLFGKEPPDSHVWILGGAAPAFVKSEQQLYYGGPVWRIELVSPAWPGGGEKK
jgi:hypothetical protein